jgi:preprotein translocase subunit SecG
MIRIIEGLIVLFFVFFIIAFLLYFFNCSYYCDPDAVLECREILGFEKYSMLMLLFLFIVYFICLKFSEKSKSS